MISSAEEASVSAAWSMVLTAMPTELSGAFTVTGGDAGYAFAVELMREFDRGKYPSWLAQLPETAQSYFISRWMSVLLNVGFDRPLRILFHCRDSFGPHEGLRWCDIDSGWKCDVRVSVPVDRFESCDSS